jgi:hypothetical protein
MSRPSAGDALHAYVQETIGADPRDWPGGYPDEIEAALLDAIYSVRARYGSRAYKTGVFGAVYRWREHRLWAANDLTVLATSTPEEVLAVVRNRGTLSGRSKAEVAIEAASRLVASRVKTADDFRANLPAARAAYLSVKGCGPVTWAYLRMLVGLDDVKADTWLMRFVHDRLPDVTRAEDAAALVNEVAERMGVESRRLDHAIWAYRRRAGKSQD